MNAKFPWQIADIRITVLSVCALVAGLCAVVTGADHAAATVPAQFSGDGISGDGNYIVHLNQVETLECHIKAGGTPDYVLIHRCWAEWDSITYAETTQMVPQRGDQSIVATTEMDGHFWYGTIYRVCIEASAYWTDNGTILTDSWCLLKGSGP